MDTTDRKMTEWWKSLTTKARKAIVRRTERHQAQAANRAAYRAAGTGGYCCPKCHKWLPTPTARRECRESHLRTESAPVAKAG
jgi:hypothetical protein